MSEPFEPQSSFEVRCENCAVTFPVGTRECIHCGQRIGRPMLPRALFGTPPDEEADFPEFPAEEVEEAESTRGRGFRFGVTALWLVAALFSALIRVCQDGS